ncbi:MAG: hypothetical protein E1N59_1598 [Puniceicoccaceae bacterium 5H]|nr:MAG: hypothetical protein E1N59_1598 [Puniceicoccaceae bacterium 5H]
MRLSALILLALSATASAQPFDLSDSGPAADDFEARFLASYGVNAEIEPKLGPDEHALYREIAPLLRDQPRAALVKVENAIGPETNAAFDFLRGNLLYQLKDYAQAESALHEALRKFPSFRRAYRTLGLIQIEQERYDAALATWLKVIELGGGDAQSYGLVAYAHLSQEHYQSALVAYQHARMFRPDSRDFRRGEAQCLLAVGEVKRAAALFDELIAEAPETHDFWLLQANAYLELERFDDAIANLEVVRDLDASTASSLRLLGNLYLRQGNHRLAIDAYTEALAQFGADDLEAALQPLDYLANQGLYDEAGGYLERLRDALPADLPPEVRRRLAVTEAGIAVEQGKPERARTLLEPVVEADPLAGKALLLLARTYQDEKDWPKAAFYLERAQSLPDFQREALIALGRMEVERGDFSTALTHLRKAQSLSASPQLARYIEAIEKAL